MESTCPFGKIQMSDSTYTLMNDKDVLSQSPYAYEITPRGAIDVKGKGKMNTYLLLGKSVVETVMRTSSMRLTVALPISAENCWSRKTVNPSLRLS